MPGYVSFAVLLVPTGAAALVFSVANNSFVQLGRRPADARPGHGAVLHVLPGRHARRRAADRLDLRAPRRAVGADPGRRGLRRRRDRRGRLAGPRTAGAPRGRAGPAAAAAARRRAPARAVPAAALRAAEEAVAEQGPGQQTRRSAEPASGSTVAVNPTAGREARWHVPLLQIGGTVAVVAAFIAWTGPVVRWVRGDRADAAGPARNPVPGPPSAPGGRRRRAPAGAARWPSCPAGAPMVRRRALWRRLRRRARRGGASCSRSRTSCGRRPRARPATSSGCGCSPPWRRPGWRCRPELVGTPALLRRRPAGGGARRPRPRAGAAARAARGAALDRAGALAPHPAVPRHGAGGARAARWWPRPAPAVAAAPPMTLRLAGGGRFGSLRRPQVAWAGLDGDVAPLVDLAGRLADAARSLGLPVEDRPFRPHLTLGRWRPGQPADGDAARPAGRLPGAGVAGDRGAAAGEPPRPAPDLRVVAAWPPGRLAVEVPTARTRRSGRPQLLLGSPGVLHGGGLVAREDLVEPGEGGVVQLDVERRAATPRTAPSCAGRRSARSRPAGAAARPARRRRAPGRARGRTPRTPPAPGGASRSASGCAPRCAVRPRSSPARRPAGRRPAGSTG